ncbi:hypothetical protein AN214_04031 [Pseudoalteromonas sp. P1-9]|nr:hypothetical protein AN214_04031 [Pseudoalteromonas sp. P1-9]
MSTPVHLAILSENSMITPFGVIPDPNTAKVTCLIDLILNNHELL